MRYGCLVLLLVAPLAAQAQTSAKPVELKWKFAEGEKFWVDTQTRVEQTQRLANQGIGSQGVVNIVRVRTITSYTVRKVSAGNYVELEAKIEKTFFDNTPTPDGKKMASLYGRLQGATFQIVLGPDYQVQRLDGYDQWCTKLAAIIDQGEVDRIRALIPESDVKNALIEGFGFLPETAVTAGQQWKKRTELNLAPVGTLTAMLNYTYRGPDKLLERITIDTKDQGKFAKNVAAATPGTNAEFVLESRTGTIWFNADKGKLEHADHTWQTRGTIQIAPPHPGALPTNVLVTNKVIVSQKVTLKPPR
jgi:hypothetical protein